MTTDPVNTLAILGEVASPPIVTGSNVMTTTVEIPPGDPGSPPHRHSGPVFG